MIVTSQIVYEGVRNLVMQFTGRGDGSGDETNVVKVDVSALTPPCARVQIRKITYDVAYGIVVLSWDAPSPTDLVLLEGHDEIDYCAEGGLQNVVAGTNGDLLLSTKSFEANSIYTLKIEMVKKRHLAPFTADR